MPEHQIKIGLFCVSVALGYDINIKQTIHVKMCLCVCVCVGQTYFNTNMLGMPVARLASKLIEVTALSVQTIHVPLISIQQ